MGNHKEPITPVFKYCTDIVQILQRYGTNVGQVLCNYSTNIAKYCTYLRVNIEHMFCKYHTKLFAYIV